MEFDAETAAEAAPRRRGPARRAVEAVLGIALGLGVAEGGFWLRDDGAFPHLNVYVPDAALGVRLRPGATEWVRVAGNRATLVRIGAEGLRGRNLPPPTPGEVIVVGDSQVFGLGVGEQETFSALLDARHAQGGPRVINAGVPTYGPPEYAAVARELIGRRSAGTVVYVVNFANDLFEAAKPNVDRHVVWDGWAVRKETAPEEVVPFPGRELILRESHAVFALRRLWHARGPELDDRGFASEGTYQDAVRSAFSPEDLRAAAAAVDKTSTERKALREAADALHAAEERVDALARTQLPSREAVDVEMVQRLSRSNPGDIVSSGYGESARSIRVTAEAIQRAALHRAALEAALERELAAKAPDGRSGEGEDPFEARRAARARLEALQAARADLESRSPLTPVLRDLKAKCDERSVELLVVALPMDVQVSWAEWQKYGEPGIDMEPTRVLIRHLIASAGALGLAALDLTSALGNAEPGAFLDGDLHLSPKGHRAVADAIAERLGEMRRERGALTDQGQLGPPHQATVETHESVHCDVQQDES